MEKKKYNLRKSDISTVGEAINDLLEGYRLRGRFDEARLVSSWERLMGKTIANRTGKIFIKNKVLFVEINSAPLKHELNLSKTKIIDIFEREIGREVIGEIIFL
ncbi:DUF721 domain-containing protein [Fulvivirga sp. 29W222]|uniref:DUF721 domain-containing protein n=1 Tax=Fulvivirga marina TaxID=2494733 RepID=A0A937FVH1_9BACT|nr:DUF721 domain-containing protein [Fulvivirga marina]MBL6446890.1 DUF721 domain-containing protein [Fulvivirga marina]